MATDKVEWRGLLKEARARFGYSPTDDDDGCIYVILGFGMLGVETERLKTLANKQQKCRAFG